MTKGQFRAKFRRERGKLEEAAESEEGAELNLIPYMDIVTNIVMFLLATITTIEMLSSVNVVIPKQSLNPSPSNSEPGKKNDKPPLNLQVLITAPGFQIIDSRGKHFQLDATGKAEIPDKLPTVPKSPQIEEVNGQKVSVIDFDYKALSVYVTQLKNGLPQEQRDKEDKVTLIPNPDIPYYVLVSTMDALRGAPVKTTPNKDKPKEIKITYPLFPNVALATGISIGP